MHDLAIRAIDEQIRLVAAEHQKVEHLVRLGMAILAGKLVAMGFLVELVTSFDLPAVLGLTSGILLVCVGIMHVFVVTVTTGSEARVEHGAKIHALDPLINGEGITTSAILTSSIESMSDAHAANEGLVGHLVVARGLAGLALGMGLLAHLGSILYIMQGVIGG